MGESRGGEGSGHSPRADHLLEAIADSILNQGPDIESVTVQYATEGLYSVEIRERGIVEPETYFLALDGEVTPLRTRTAIGGPTGRVQEG